MEARLREARSSQGLELVRVMMVMMMHHDNDKNDDDGGDDDNKFAKQDTHVGYILKKYSLDKYTSERAFKPSYTFSSI